MTDLVNMCDVVLGNEEDTDKIFGIKAPESDITAGKVDLDHYHYVCDKLANRFPVLKTILITLRFVFRQL
jgi:2-dehydro-3-deoxygluconokinase